MTHFKCNYQQSETSKFLSQCREAFGLILLSLFAIMLFSVSQVYAIDGPIINGSLYLNESDIFVSNVSPNNVITVFADVNSAGPNQISYVTANFSELYQSTSYINMTQLNGHRKVNVEHQ